MIPINFQYAVLKDIHGNKLPSKVYADKRYYGRFPRSFLSMNGIADGIIRKNLAGVKLTDFEIRRNKMISKVRYKIEQYFGLTALYYGAGKVRFTTLVKEGWGRILSTMAFNIKRTLILLSFTMIVNLS